MRKIVSRLKKLVKINKPLTKISRLKKFAEWTQLNLQDPNLMQYITDCMVNGYPMQINYENSGWRTIYPYGFNTSNDGNVLIMCYKDSGEIRSYRMDRIYDMYVDYNNGMPMENNDQMQSDEFNDLIYDNMSNEQYIENFPVIEDDNLDNLNFNDIENEEGVYQDIIDNFDELDEVNLDDIENNDNKRGEV